MVSISKLGLLFSLLLTTLFPFQLRGSGSGFVASEAEDSLFPPSKVDVIIINYMAEKDLIFRCQDKHHDLGTQVLSYSEGFTFSFKPNKFVKITLYFCFFTWVGGKGHHFDIYDEDRDDCAECLWKIFETGPCIVRPKFNRCYVWNK